MAQSIGETMYNKLLVVSSARSGTTFMSKLMRVLGFQTRMEGILPDRNSFDYQVEIAAGANGRILEVPDNYFIAHQVRHPLKAIRRYLFTFFQDPTFTDGPIMCYNKTFENKLPAPPPIERNMEIVCEFYCRWNKLAQDLMSKLPVERTHQYKIEDIDTEIFTLASAIGVNLDKERTKRILADLGTETHSRKYDIPDATKERPWIEGDGLFEHIGFDDVTPELQDYILELGYAKDA